MVQSLIFHFPLHYSFVLFNGMALSVVYSLLVPLSGALGVTGTSIPETLSTLGLVLTDTHSG